MFVAFWCLAVTHAKDCPFKEHAQNLPHTEVMGYCIDAFHEINTNGAFLTRPIVLKKTQLCDRTGSYYVTNFQLYVEMGCDMQADQLKVHFRDANSFDVKMIIEKLKVENPCAIGGTLWSDCKGKIHKYEEETKLMLAKVTYAERTYKRDAVKRTKAINKINKNYEKLQESFNFCQNEMEKLSQLLRDHKCCDESEENYDNMLAAYEFCKSEESEKAKGLLQSSGRILI